MLAVGANMITPSVQETAEAARIDASTRSSALMSATNNVSAGIRAALMDCALFMGGDPSQVKYQLNQQFYPENIDAQTMMAMVQLMDRQVLGLTDVRAKVRSAGFIAQNRTDEEIDQEAGEVEPLLPVVASV